MKRIFHPYWLWEDYKHGFYDNVSGDQKKVKVEKVLELFSDKEKTREYMLRVVNEWKYSCEHNLTNDSINKIAYIGQGACCLYAEIPSSITMFAWSLVPEKNQKEANKIAKEVLQHWIDNNKNIQLCLNLD